MVIDISPPINERLQVWPGDTRPQREVLLDMKKGAHLTLSTLHATVHLGAHADAPSHYGRDAEDIDARRLDFYLGPCQVVRVAAARGRRISLDMLDQPIRQPRVLFATDTFPDPETFNPDFAAIDPHLIEAFAAQGVRLIGIDTPSIDLFDSTDLPSHLACLKHDLAILEGLTLKGVTEGEYELIALPLRLVGFDASPVRAVLRTIGN
jgi:arylformamidase